MGIIGINENHCSTACILEKGRVIACASEERFTRKKNQSGFPINAFSYVAGMATEPIEKIVFAWENPGQYFYEESGKSAEKNAISFMKNAYSNVLRSVEYHSRFNPAFDFMDDAIVSIQKGILSAKRREMTSKIAKVQGENIISVNHHLAHIYSTFFLLDPDKKTLVMTQDGEGDDSCGTISVLQKNKLKMIRKIRNKRSPAALYGKVTQFLGMRFNEDEYKVMGLAAYNEKSPVSEEVKRILDDVEWADGLDIKSRIRVGAVDEYLNKKLCGKRFDYVASGTQKHTEELALKWINEALKRTKTAKLALAGGLFMNVKLNMRIMYETPIDELIVFPSPGDLSTPFGAAYHGWMLKCEEEGSKFTPQLLKDLYLGPEFTENEIEEALRKEQLKYSKVGGIEGEIAELLSKGEIVARFNGRMEWGARALGNRSILADPSNLRLIRELNKQIKSRDFWMPFAGTILKEREGDYIINPKKIPSPYMIMAFKSTPLAQKELICAMHQYDFSIRPQVLEKDWNESYFKTISEFEKITGMGGVLNTSFNLHGDPIVCSPHDAIYTFKNSGLKYLAIGDFLVTK